MRRRLATVPLHRKRTTVECDRSDHCPRPACRTSLPLASIDKHARAAEIPKAAPAAPATTAAATPPHHRHTFHRPVRSRASDTSDGLLLTDLDGTYDGSAVGDAVGFSEGSTVGDAVGFAEGSTVGDGVGFSEGLTFGLVIVGAVPAGPRVDSVGALKLLAKKRKSSTRTSLPVESSRARTGLAGLPVEAANASHSALQHASKRRSRKWRCQHRELFPAVLERTLTAK